MLRNMEGLEAVADIIHHHRENIDGSGFFGIKGRTCLQRQNCLEYVIVMMKNKTSIKMHTVGL